MLQRYKINVTVLYFYTEKKSKERIALSITWSCKTITYFSSESSRLYWRTLFPPLKR